MKNNPVNIEEARYMREKGCWGHHWGQLVLMFLWSRIFSSLLFSILFNERWVWGGRGEKSSDVQTDFIEIRSHSHFFSLNNDLKARAVGSINHKCGGMNVEPEQREKKYKILIPMLLQFFCPTLILMVDSVIWKYIQRFFLLFL